MSSVNFAAPSFDSMIRRNSMPPATFLALAGTMNASAALIRVQSNGSLAPSSSGVGATVVTNSAGATLFCSFSSHEPHGMKAALPSFQAVWDWMWSRPSVPSSM